jgi:hypothetical protein
MRHNEKKLVMIEGLKKLNGRALAVARGARGREIWGLILAIFSF